MRRNGRTSTTATAARLFANLRRPMRHPAVVGCGSHPRGLEMLRPFVRDRRRARMRDDFVQVPLLLGKFHKLSLA